MADITMESLQRKLQELRAGVREDLRVELQRLIPPQGRLSSAVESIPEDSSLQGGSFDVQKLLSIGSNNSDLAVRDYASQESSGQQNSLTQAAFLNSHELPLRSTPSSGSGMQESGCPPSRSSGAIEMPRQSTRTSYVNATTPSPMNVGGLADDFSFHEASRTSSACRQTSVQTKRLSRSFGINVAATFGQAAQKRSKVKALQSSQSRSSLVRQSTQFRAEPVIGEIIAASHESQAIHGKSNGKSNGVLLTEAGSRNSLARVIRPQSLLEADGLSAEEEAPYAREDSRSEESCTLIETPAVSVRRSGRVSIEESEHQYSKTEMLGMAQMASRRSRFRSTRSTTKHLGRLERFVLSPTFEILQIVAVLLNAISIGIESDLDAKGQARDYRRVTGPLFCLVFTLEVALRMWTWGIQYFIGESWDWNLFDLLMVGAQLMDELQFLMATQKNKDLSVLRLLRFIRLVRIGRLFRVVNLFEDLRRIASSMYHSFGALIWAMILLFVVLYMFSVLCIQVVTFTERAGKTQHYVKLHYYFGSLSRTMLTMFECIVGGVSWDEVVMPLIVDVSPMMGIAFCGYLTLSLYALTNMLTGVFVERAMAQTREDKDTSLANRINDLFFEEDLDDTEITWDHFEDALDHPTMQEYFKVINVDVSEASRIFDLLDADGGGSVDAKELVIGILRLRGPARALDVGLLVRMMEKVQTDIEQLIELTSPSAASGVNNFSPIEH